MVAMNNTSKHDNQGVCLHLLTQVPFIIVTPSPVSIYSYRPCSRRFGPNEPRRARFVPRLLFHEGLLQSVADTPKTSGSDWPVTACNLHKRALDRCLSTSYGFMLNCAGIDLRLELPAAQTSQMRHGGGRCQPSCPSGGVCIVNETDGLMPGT